MLLIHRCIVALSILALSTPTCAAWDDTKWSNAASFPLEHVGTLTNPYESLVIGNGDLAASAQVMSHQLTLSLGKNDVWDSRIRTLTADAVVRHDDLLASKGTGDRLHDHSSLVSWDYVGKNTPGPTLKRVGSILIRHPGLSGTQVRSKVDIARGVLRVEYGFPEGQLNIETLVHRRKNVVMMRLSAKGKIPWLTIILQKLPDSVDAAMPAPTVSPGPDDRQWAISQTIPGGYGVSDFSWHLAGNYPHGGQNARVSDVIRRPWMAEQNITLADGGSVVFAVGVATDRDGSEDAVTRAFRLAGSCGAEGYQQERTAHVEAWEEFWAASAIDLQDESLEALWYRCMFGFACHLSPGAQAPGLNANIPIYDYTAWNGFYTWNHNVQKWYLPALPVNHPEWYEVFADLVDQHLPVFEQLARLIFDLEGVYCDLMTAPYAPAERAKTHTVFGRALAHTGWLSALLYQHYEFTGDTEWLRQRAYPYMAKAAEFYCNYLDKYQEPGGDIFPSMLLEDTRRWQPDFERSRNTVTDVVMFRKALTLAAEAAELLDVDAARREKWKQYLQRIPPIEYGWKDGRGWYAIHKNWEQAWPDFDEYLHHVRTSRWGCSGWLIFPGEHIAGDEPEGLAKAVRDTLRPTDLLNLPDRTRMLGTFHGEGNFLPFIRMGMREHFPALRTLLLNHRFSSGQFSPYSTGEQIHIRSVNTASWRIVENQYFPILGSAEMLLQSQGDVIRLFPFWPRKQSAAFRDLRARGGFMVSAKWSPDRGVQASITSHLGNACRVRWSDVRKPVVTCLGESVALTVDGDDIVFDTKAGATYELKQR